MTTARRKGSPCRAAPTPPSMTRPTTEQTLLRSPFPEQPDDGKGRGRSIGASEGWVSGFLNGSAPAQRQVVGQAEGEADLGGARRVRVAQRPDDSSLYRKGLGAVTAAVAPPPPAPPERPCRSGSALLALGPPCAIVSGTETGGFVGRAVELVVLEAALADACAAQPRVVLIQGAAGMGKSALLRRFLGCLEGVRVLFASGDETETSLVYGVVGQLLGGLPGPLPGPLASLGGQGPTADPLTVGAALVELLGVLQDEGPVVVVLDDAHWADTASLQALLFALRRLRVDRVLALFAAREEALGALPPSLHRLVATEVGATISLGPLPPPDVARLAASAGAGDLPAAALERLAAHTGGNPLHVRALLAELPRAALLADELPAPRSYAALVLSRLAACPPEAEALVVAAAVLGLRCPLGVAARVGGVDDPLAAAEAAAAAGLVEPTVGLTAAEIAFTHPLVRAAVYGDLALTRRAALHARAAEVVDDPGAALRHRVAATAAEDPALAAEAADHARREAGRGAWAAAAEGFLPAARLSPGRGDRERHLIEAVDCLILGGEFGRAVALAEEFAAFAHQARRGYGLGRLALFAGREAEAAPLLSAAWESCDHQSEPELAARIAGTLAMVYVRDAQVVTAAEWARRALESDPGASATGLARIILAMCLTVMGREAEAMAAVVHLPEDPGGVGPAEADALVGRGVARLWSDELEGARTDLALAVSACRGRGPFLIGLVALFYLADAEYRLGRWDDAVIHAEVAASQADDAEDAISRPVTHAVATFALAARGDWERAESHAEAASAAASALRDPTSTLWAAIAGGRFGAAQGDHARAAAALEPMVGLVRARPDIDEPTVQPWRELYADALLRLGRLEEAEGVLAPLEARAAERGRHSSLAGAARVRGMLEATRGREHAARAAFEAGLCHAAQVAMPFERARLEDAYGRFLRRAGARRRAREQLASAQQAYLTLGARPYLERLERELAACGLTPARRSAAHHLQLTPQELAVARLVAAGKTNREVAAELVVSAKTVGYHLGNVYAKLGVSSRTQLAAHFAAAGALSPQGVED
ncbi:MAG TPA: AAA family ATPase [Acidimicrobiales bacterium]|nr:AAA family ATPase [Acidimicrobiales bacterium]